MSFQNIPLEQKLQTLDELRDIKGQFAARNWFPGTSGNLSIRVGDYTPESFHFAVTASGKDKSVHTPEDFLFVDQLGRPCENTQLKPSAETLIHSEIYRLTGCGAIFHVHTVFNNIVSQHYGDLGYVTAKGIELIKGLGIWEEEAEIQIPVLPNYADIPSIASLIQDAIQPRIPGIVIRNHGICAWGKNAFEAKRHIEAFEFIFEHLYYSLLIPRSH